MSERYEAARAGEGAESGRVARFRDLIEPNRHYVDVFVLPNVPFEVHALPEVIERDAFSYCEIVVSHKIAV
jgi:hypothetical protein